MNSVEHLEVYIGQFVGLGILVGIGWLIGYIIVKAKKTAKHDASPITKEDISKTLNGKVGCLPAIIAIIVVVGGFALIMSLLD